MSVADTHPEFDDIRGALKLMRDANSGEDAVKDAGTDYLPKMGGHTDSEYAAYKQRASFFGATGRTVDGLTGMIFKKPPQLDYPESMSALVEDATLGGLPLLGFSEMVVEEVMVASRCGVLVDFPDINVSGMTQADADRIGVRPFLTMYRAEHIFNWRTAKIGAQTVLTQVRLKEVGYEEGSDEFEDVRYERIRVLDLIEGQYRQRVFVKDDQDNWVQSGEDIYPRMNGRPMGYIPFIFVGPRDTTPSVDKPVLLDLAKKNMDHYRIDADYHHILHFLAAGMTPYAKGVREKEIEAGHFSATGPTNIWATTSDAAEFGVLEFTGAGVGALRTAMQDCEGQMASLGARMLAPEKRQVEAAETAGINRQGEISVLASIANSVSKALTMAMEIARDWWAISGEVSISLNSDFLPNKIEPQMIDVLLRAMQQGRLSYTVFFQKLQEGQIIPEDRQIEDEQSELETSGQAAGGGDLRGFL